MKKAMALVLIMATFMAGVITATGGWSKKAVPTLESMVYSVSYQEHVIDPIYEDFRVEDLRVEITEYEPENNRVNYLIYDGDVLRFRCGTDINYLTYNYNN